MARGIRYADAARWARAAAIALLVSFYGGGAVAQHADNGGSLGDHTFLSYDDQHGVQIEYLTGDGLAHLWYPGEARVISGTWRAAGEEICFVYPEYDFELAPERPAGDAHCMTLANFFATTLSKTENDPFALAGGGAPFVLHRSDYFDSFEAVRAAMGGD